MELTRKIGIAVVYSIFAIIGAGVAWALSENWQVVFTYLGLLGFTLVVFIFNPEQIVNRRVHGEKAEE